MIKTVIFDIDGTMYDYDTCNRLALDALEQYAASELFLPGEEFRRLLKEGDRLMVSRMGHSGASIHNRLIRYQCTLELAGRPVFPHAMKMYRVYWDALLGAVRPYDGIADWMAQLRAQGIGVGVGSNMTAYMQYRKLELMELGGLIDWIVTSEEAGSEKPELRIFEQCIAKSGAAPEECLFVGDSMKHDVTGAVAAGLHTLLFDPAGKYAACEAAGTHEAAAGTCEAAGMQRAAVGAQETTAGKCESAAAREAMSQGHVRADRIIRSYAECLEPGFLSTFGGPL